MIGHSFHRFVYNLLVRFRKKCFEVDLILFEGVERGQSLGGKQDTSLVIPRLYLYVRIVFSLDLRKKIWMKKRTKIINNSYLHHVVISSADTWLALVGAV